MKDIMVITNGILTSVTLTNAGRGYIKEEKEFSINQLEKCFNESRLSSPIKGFKYDTFSDYYNQMNKDENTK